MARFFNFFICWITLKIGEPQWLNGHHSTFLVGDRGLIPRMVVDSVSVNYSLIGPRCEIVPVNVGRTESVADPGGGGPGGSGPPAPVKTSQKKDGRHCRPHVSLVIGAPPRTNFWIRYWELHVPAMYWMSGGTTVPILLKVMAYTKVESTLGSLVKLYTAADRKLCV